MKTDLPFICNGTIIAIEDPIENEYNVIRYTCMVKMPEGREIVIPKVRQASLFGGIGDYFRHVAKPAEADSQSFGSSVNVVPQGFADASVGDRVLIAFIGGHITNPIIIGYDQHPNQMEEKDLEEKDPGLVFQYNGIRAKINKDGDLSIIHKGEPKVKFVDPITAGAGGAVSGLLGSIDNPEVGGSDGLRVSSVDKDELTVLEMTKGGVFRIRDPLGQMIEIDPNKPRIYISNNDLKSSEDASGGPASGGNQLLSNSTDAEYILLDADKGLVLINARKTVQIYSFGARKDVTDGDHSHKVKGNNKWTILGDDASTIIGNSETTVAGDFKMTGVKGEITFGPAKLMDSLVQLLDALVQNAPTFVSTTTGPGVLSPQVVALATQLKLLFEAGKA